jgi:exosortase/archaeosortase
MRSLPNFDRAVLIILLLLNLMRNVFSNDSHASETTGHNSYNPPSELFFYFAVGWAIFGLDWVSALSDLLAASHCLYPLIVILKPRRY